MSSPSFERRTSIDVPVDELRDWHLRPGAFSRLQPPWERAEVVESPGALEDGARAVIEVGLGPLRKRWVAEHEITDFGFVDRQVEGPFSSWEHRHRFEPRGDSGSVLIDSIDYRLPLGPLGELGGGRFVRRKLDRMFRYRHDLTRADLERRRDEPDFSPLSLLVTGATGLIGTALTGFLETRGHTVHRVTRRPRRPDDIRWDLESGTIDLPDHLRIDAAIHLAGENVASGRWTEARKRAIRESRVRGTRLLAETLAARPEPPSVLVSASGAAAYPFGEEAHDESGPREAGPREAGPRAGGFLAEVCREWEGAADPARRAGIRVVHPRIGVVLTPAGGALAKLAPLFLSGLGGPVGNGSQRLSWIAIDDVVDALHRSVIDPAWEGPVNFVAPEPVTNHAFSRTLAEVLHRPCALPVPATALRAVFGEMADETLLADNAVLPGRFRELSYPFRHPDLPGALRHLLGRHDASE